MVDGLGQEWPDDPRGAFEEDRPWRQDVKAAAEQVRAQLGLALLDEPLRVRMTFTLPKPASALKRRVILPSKLPDLSKLVGSTEDAITDASVWRDDAKVVECIVMEAVYLPGGALRHRPKLADALLAIVARVGAGCRMRSAALHQRQAAVDQARVAAWPRNAYQHLITMVDAVVQVLARGNHSSNCHGTGLVNDKACPECRCTGIEPLPD